MVNGLFEFSQVISNSICNWGDYSVKSSFFRSRRRKIPGLFLKGQFFVLLFPERTEAGSQMVRSLPRADLRNAVVPPVRQLSGEIIVGPNSKFSGMF